MVPYNEERKGMVGYPDVDFVSDLWLDMLPCLPVYYVEDGKNRNMIFGS